MIKNVVQYIVVGMLISSSVNAQLNSALRSAPAVKDSMPELRNTLATTGKKPVKNKIEIHGTARVFSHHSNFNYNYQSGPSSYTGYEIVPQIKIGHLLFTAPVRINTQQRAVSYNLNSAAISFDQRAFRNSLIGKAREEANLHSRFRDSLQRELEKELAGITGLQSYKDSIDSRIKKLLNDTAFLRDTLLSDSILPGIDTALISQLRKGADSLDRLYSKALEAKAHYLKLKESGFFDRPEDFFNPDDLKRKYRPSKYFALSPLERVFTCVNSLQVGNFNPYYSSLYIHGANLSGLNTEIQKGPLYFAFTGGLVNQHLNFNTLKPGIEKRWLWGARVGLGQADGTHFIVSAFSSKVKERKVSDSLPRFDIPSPDGNRVITAEARLNTGRSSYLLAEYGISNTSTQLVLHDSSTGEQLSGSTTATLFSKDQSRHAWKIYWFTEFSKTGTRLSVGGSRTGTFYHSIGNPYLRKDLLRKEIRLTQPLFGKLLRLSSSASFDRDNLAGIKLYSSEYHTYSNALDIKIKRWPVFKLMHTLRSQFTRASAYQLRYEVQQITLSSSYYRTFKVDHRFAWMLALAGMSFGQSGQPAQKTYFSSLSQNYTWKEKLNLIYNGNILLSGRSDSSLVNAHQLSLSLKYKKMLTGISGRFNHDHVHGAMSGIMLTHDMALWKDAFFKVEAGINRFEKLSEFVTQHRQYILKLQITQLW